MSGKIEVASEYVKWREASEPIVGRKWAAHDGPVTVIDRTTPGGMVFVRRADGREHCMRPSFIEAALAESEIFE